MIKKMLKNRKKEEAPLPARITNDTVAQHREKILAGGRKHKYPLQYTKHKLVWNTVIIGFVGLLVAMFAMWIQLYVVKDTSDLAYRITQIIPLPVAKIDGEPVRYSEYLLYHRSTLATYEKQNRDLPPDRLAFLQQQSMNQATKNAYARKIAREKGITVDAKRVDQELATQQEKSGLSQAAYEKVVRDTLNFSMDELRQTIEAKLLVQDVAFAVDDLATATLGKAESLKKQGKNLEQIAEALGSAVQYNGGVMLPKDNKDGGLTAAAANMNPGETSGPVQPLLGDGYYFIHLKKKTDNDVEYAFLRIPITVFQKDFDKTLNDDTLTQYYISVETSEK